MWFTVKGPWTKTLEFTPIPRFCRLSLMGGFVALLLCGQLFPGMELDLWTVSQLWLSAGRVTLNHWDKMAAHLCTNNAPTMAEGSLFYTRITRLTRVFLHPPLPRAAVGVIYFPWAEPMHCAGLTSERLGNWLKVPTGKMHSRPCTPSLTHWTLGKTMQSPARGTKRALLTPLPVSRFRVLEESTS